MQNKTTDLNMIGMKISAVMCHYMIIIKSVAFYISS